MNILLAEDVAKEFARTNGRSFDSGRQLVDAVDQFMASRGLAKSKIDRLDVAEHVLRLQSQVPSPEEAAFEENLAEGTTADDEALQHAMRQADERVLIARVQAMNGHEFAQFRRQAGMERDLVQFLGGTE